MTNKFVEHQIVVPKIDILYHHQKFIFGVAFGDGSSGAWIRVL